MYIHVYTYELLNVAKCIEIDDGIFEQLISTVNYLSVIYVLYRSNSQ